MTGMWIEFVAGLVALITVMVFNARQVQERERAWDRERRELLNRIQAPDRIPVGSPQPFVWPDEPADEIERVGMIHEDGSE